MHHPGKALRRKKQVTCTRATRSPRPKKQGKKIDLRHSPYRSDAATSPRSPGGGLRCHSCDCDLTARSAWAQWDDPPGPNEPSGPSLITPADVMAHPERGRRPADAAEAVCKRCAPVGRSIPWVEMVKLRARRFATGMTLEAVDRELKRLGTHYANPLRRAKRRHKRVEVGR